MIKGFSAPWLCVLACDYLSLFPHWTLTRTRAGTRAALFALAVLVPLSAPVLPCIGLWARHRQTSACSSPSAPWGWVVLPHYPGEDR